MNERLRIATLLGLTTLVYGNTLLNGFTLDDYLYIFFNPAVTSPSVRGLFAATKDFNVFRPVTFATLALNWPAGGAHAWGYHLVNLLLHAAVTLLLYLVLRKLLVIVPQGAIVAWSAALLFAVHPFPTDAGASICGRSALMALRYLVKALLRYACIAGVGVLYMSVIWRAQGGRFGEKGVNFLDNPLAHLPASLRILNALRVAWKYLALHVYPATLSCDYSYNGILLYSNLRHTLPPAVLAASVLALWIWAIWTKRKEWVLAGAIYLAGFSVTANILVPTGTIMGERLAYLPSAGFCLLVALVFIRLGHSNRKLATAGFTILVAALATRTVVRNRDWRDNFTLFSAAVRAVPGSARAHAGLGGEYMRRDQLDSASREFQIVLGIYPDFVQVMNSYGIVESRLGHDQEALRLMQKALSMTRKDDTNYDYYAVALAAQLMKLGKNDEALKLLNEEIASSPAYSRAWSNRAVIRYWFGEGESARADAAAALRLDPSNTQAQNLLGVLNKSGPRTPQP